MFLEIIIFARNLTVKRRNLWFSGVSKYCLLMSDALIVYFEQSIPETGISHFLSRTEIDLKGHRLAQHSGALSKVS